MSSWVSGYDFSFLVLRRFLVAPGMKRRSQGSAGGRPRGGRRSLTPAPRGASLFRWRGSGSSLCGGCVSWWGPSGVRGCDGVPAPVGFPGCGHVPVGGGIHPFAAW